MDIPKPGNPVIELVGITKSFGSILANDTISLSVERGEILGLLGENGAGKSTLLSILAGFERADAGIVRMDGDAVSLASPARSLRLGISLVHQHFSLVPTFTVREQLRLAGWRGATLPPILGKDITADMRISDLAPGQRQRVELAKALVPDPRVLLLDEPTSILAPSEVDRLFATLGRLRDAGTAVVFVTHKVREVLSHADRIVVMRRGRISGTFERGANVWPSGTEQRVVAAMFDNAEGRITSAITGAETGVSGSRPVLVAAHLTTVGSHGAVGLRNVDVAIRRGDIHAVVGIDGQGQGILADVLAGYKKATGRIKLDGTPITGGAEAFAAAGVAFITGERQRDGGVGAFSIAENLLLKRQRDAPFTSRRMIQKGKVSSWARTAIREWDIRPPDPAFAYGSLSGGNMQKVLLARELERRPRVVIAVNPVAGLDPQAAQAVRDRLRGFVQDGGAVLWFTNDVEDAMAVADRISVMFEGRLSPAMVASGAPLRHISEMMVAGW